MLVGVELVIMLHHIITQCSLHTLLVALIRLHVAILIYSLKSQVAREKISLCMPFDLERLHHDHTLGHDCV